VEAVIKFWRESVDCYLAALAGIIYAVADCEKAADYSKN
jgi:hypothetical protein